MAQTDRGPDQAGLGEDCVPTETAIECATETGVDAVGIK